MKEESRSTRMARGMNPTMSGRSPRLVDGLGHVDRRWQGRRAAGLEGNRPERLSLGVP